MRSLTYIFFATCLAHLTYTPLKAVESQNEPQEEQTTPSKSPSAVSNNSSVKNITPFTGKISKDKVRLRLNPTLDAAVVRELKTGDMLIVTGESDDFYVVEPPADIKAYIYRTFVLDGVVEGSRVNVRLAPVLDAPVIAQVNSGDFILNGIIAGNDKKWIEFTPPTSTRFYVAKEFVTKIGDKSMLTTMKKRREDVNAIVTMAAQTIQSEMRKPFDQINIDEPLKKLQKASTEYADFPEEAAKAKALATTTQEAYLQKKLLFMEAKVKTLAANQPAPKSEPIETIESAPVEEKVAQPARPALNNKMSAWEGAEQQLFEEYARQVPNATKEDFYQAQQEEAVVLQGVIEPYNRAVRNKPGDFILVTQNNHLPIAFLYSTKIDLEDKVGQAVSIKAVPRANNNFAFPAYFVISVQ